MHQLKYRDCLKGSKYTTQLYVVPKKPTLNIKTQTDLNKGIEKDIPCYFTNQKKLE